MALGLVYTSLSMSVLLHLSAFGSVPHKAESVVYTRCDSERKGHHTSCIGGSRPGPGVLKPAGNSESSVVV